MLARRIVVAIAIAFLLPMVVFQGVNVLCRVPPPFDSTTYDQRIAATKSPSEKQKLISGKAAAQAASEAADQRVQRVLFYVGYPVGLLAFVAGGFFKSGWAGIGLMYGGIATVAYSTYDYWAQMDRYLRLEALALAFFIVLVYGLIKVRPGLRDPGSGSVPRTS